VNAISREREGGDDERRGRTGRCRCKKKKICGGGGKKCILTKGRPRRLEDEKEKKKDCSMGAIRKAGRDRARQTKKKGKRPWDLQKATVRKKERKTRSRWVLKKARRQRGHLAKKGGSILQPSAGKWWSAEKKKRLAGRGGDLFVA